MSSTAFFHTDLFRRVFDGSAVSLAVCTLKEGRFIEVNEYFVRLLGLSRDELIGRNAPDLDLWSEPGAFRDLLNKVAAQNRVQELELRVHTQAGGIRDLLVSAERLDPQDDACVLITAYDITERVRQEVQVRQAQKMEAVGQLASGFAHGFNNLLAVVQGYAGLLLAEPNLDPQTAKALKEVCTAAEKGANLTRQLLVFSRKQVMQARLLNINEVITGSAAMLKHLLGEKIEVVFDLWQQPLTIEADTRMLEQVLVNLAANSRDAMPNGGQFFINTVSVISHDWSGRSSGKEEPGPYACIRISDSGCGMNPETLNRIFEPFFTTKDVGQGVGLGLSTAYGIIKQHNGWIEVTSQPGKGTNFRIFLPAREAARSTVKPISPRPPSAGKERILVVEDEAPLRVMVESILQRQGYQVVTAINGVEALRTWSAQQGSFDLLLTDMAMPEGMTGRELADQLRDQKPALKVVYTSGYSVDLISQEGEELVECVNFLQKPYHPNRLAETVRACLDDTKSAPQRG